MSSCQASGSPQYGEYAMKALSSILILLVFASISLAQQPKRNRARRTVETKKLPAPDSLMFLSQTIQTLTTKVSEQTVEINKLKDAVQTNDFHKARLGQMEVERDVYKRLADRSLPYWWAGVLVIVAALTGFAVGLRFYATKLNAGEKKYAKRLTLIKNNEGMKTGP
jgi:hypothetical protein